MKKGLKITGIVLACILVLMIVLPYAFRGKIKEMVITEGNKMLRAQFNFGNLDISLFKNFPKASITLNHFWLKGVGEFENDTLVKAKEVTAAINIFSLLGNNSYDISKISIEDTYLKAIILENGKANWDIMKPGATATAETPEEDTTSPFSIKLEKLTLKNVHIIYDDRQEKIYADIKDFGAICSGDFSAERTTINLEAETNSLSFLINGIPFLSDANIYTKMDVDADLSHNKYILKDNEFRLNAIKANIDGWITLLSNGMDMDLKLNTGDIGFKEILSLIPAIYSKDFENVKTDGTVTLSAFAKGMMQGDTLPRLDATMTVKNAMFRYPGLPAGVDQINISAQVKNPGGSMNLTEINIQPFSFRLAGNPFSVTANIKTPVSDPDFKISAKGTLNLGMIKQVYPLENMELNGIISADMNLAGRLSDMEREQYNKINASGTITLSGMTLKMKDMPDIDIRKSIFTFTPQYLNLSQTTVNIGKNDITANCRLENYLAYALKGKTIKGNLNIQSVRFNLNDFMSAPQASKPVAATPGTASPAPTSVIEIPKNINFNINTDMKQVLFGNMQFNTINGVLIIKDGKADMKNLSMNTMGGSVKMNGYYSTAASVTSPVLNASFDMNSLSFAQTYKELDMIQKMAPIFENLKGNYSGNIKIDTRLNAEMSPELNTLQGNGSLSTKDLSLSGVKVIDQIAGAVKMPGLKELKVKDMKLDFTIKDGRIETKPFDLKLGETTLNLSGSTGLDQTIDYSGKIKLPASAGTVGSLTTLDLKIGGTFTSPNVSLDTKSMANQAINAAKDKAIDEIGKKLGVDLGDAQKQKDALVAAATNAGDKLIAEAQKQADALTEKAGENVLKKLGAQKAGEMLVKEAQKQKDKLVGEAVRQGDTLIEKAKAQ